MGSYAYRYPYSYAPVTHAYGNVDHPVGTGYLYTRLPADIPYGEQTREAYSYSTPVVYPSYVPRLSYSYAPVTHAYGNVDYAVGTPLMAARPPADIHYGEQTREAYSYSAPVVYPAPVYSLPRYSYSYAPATHAYGNVDYAVGPPLMASRPPADIH